ncbi:MAG: phosphatidylglycerophosphatase A [Pseudobdellovibrionaceae bacterium]
MDSIAKQIATFFGIGKAPKAPGTFGTLAALPLALGLNFLGPFYIMGFVLLFTPVAIWACDRHCKNLQAEDPQEIVIDEVLGFVIAMTWLPMTWQAYVAGFILFRVLDITKPLLIGYLDRKLSGGFGVMADDIVAGVVSNIFLQVLYSQTTWLGAQIR